jgi:hypothetical protein
MIEDNQQKIIALQEEMIQLLTNGLQARDKYIAILEKQLSIIEKYTNNEQQK